MKNLEKMESLKDALDEAREKGDAAAEAGALYGIGQIYYKEKVWEAAEDFWRQCEDVCRKTDQAPELAQTLLSLGDAAAVQGGGEAAKERYAEALERFTELNNLQGRAKAMERYGGALRELGQAEPALDQFRAGLELCRLNEDQIGALYFLEQITQLLKITGTPAEIEAAYRDSITLAEKIGDRDRMALALVGLADVVGRARGPKEAEPYLVLAHDIYIRLGKTREADLIRNALEKSSGAPIASSGE